MLSHLVHGSASSSRVWAAILPTFEDAVALDLPGALGQRPRHAVAEAVLAEDVAFLGAQLDAAGGPQALVGHSYGGLLALHAARRWPDRVAAVYAHDPLAWSVLRDRGTPAQRSAFEALMGAEALLDPARRRTEAWIADVVAFWNGPDAWDGLPAPARAALLATADRTFLEVRDAMQDPTTPEDWAGLAVPVRLTVGRLTPRLAREAVEQLVAVLPDATLTEVPGGHLAVRTHPDGVLGAWRGADPPLR